MAETTKTVRGDLKSFSIFDVTQSLMMGRKTALVTVETGNRKGYVYFKDGQIISALDDALTSGEAAVMDIFSWTGGSFTIDFEVEPNEVNIDLPTDHLLLEVARNLDEGRRDRGLDAEGEIEDESRESIVSDARSKVGERLRTQLNSVFKKVAVAAEPGRDRHTTNAFDILLQALLELSGTVLFLRPGSRPRIKTREGFMTIKDQAVIEGEIEGFISALLSDSEAMQLREEKEVCTFFHSPLLGTFKVTVLNELGTHLVTFNPTGRPVSRLSRMCPDPVLFQSLQAQTEGLIIVAGPMGCGKSEFVTALLDHHLEHRDAFAVEFSAGTRHGMTSKRGFCVQRSLPASGPPLRLAVQAALEQGPDVIAFVNGSGGECFGLALGACSQQRLAIYTLESRSPKDTVERALHFARSQEVDGSLEPMADRVRLIIDMAPGHHPTVASILDLQEAHREMIRKGDLAGLARESLASSLA